MFEGREFYRNWLDKLLIKFNYSEEEFDKANYEILEFVEILWNKCDKKFMFDETFCFTKFLLLLGIH